jgi:chlorite dismutase
MKDVLAEMGAARSGVYSMFGHKGDLMLVHFRRDPAELNAAELRLTQTRLWDYLEPTTSYFSVVELGLYESTQRIHRVFSEQGLEPGSEAWSQALAEEMDRQRTAMEPRLFPDIPPHRYI